MYHTKELTYKEWARLCLTSEPSTGHRITQRYCHARGRGFSSMKHAGIVRALKELVESGEAVMVINDYGEPLYSRSS